MYKRTNVTDEDVDKLLKVFGQLSSCNIWSRVQRQDFTVKRFESGYVNDIAACTLTADAERRLCQYSTDPKAVVVKFFVPELFQERNRTEIVAINTCISENKLCPRLLYIDEQTTINEFIQCRNYSVEDDLEIDTVKQCARVLAQFHSLKPPLSKNGFNKWDIFNENLRQEPGAEEIYGNKFLKYLEADPLLKEKYYEVFLDLDIEEIIEFSRKAMLDINSPTVFSHNDFNRGNRIVQVVKDDSGNTKKKIYFVDFDYSTYNFRGFDLARYFSNYRHADDMFGNEGLPTDEEMGIFLKEYQMECSRVQGDFYLKQEINSIEQLIKEVKVFLLDILTIDFFFCLVLYNLNPKGNEKEYFLESTKNRYEFFKDVRKRITSDGILTF